MEQFETHRIFSIGKASEFNDLALDVFRFQFENNVVYQDFCQHLKKKRAAVELFAKPFVRTHFLKIVIFEDSLFGPQKTNGALAKAIIAISWGSGRGWGAETWGPGGNFTQDNCTASVVCMPRNWI